MTPKRILILVPHPDDEVVACCAAIGRAQKKGAELFALYLTHGCIARETRWPWDRKNHESRVARRMAEAHEAATVLGLKPLGKPLRHARHLWRHLRAAYEEAKKAIETHQINEVWVPAYEGGNADHDGLNAIGSVLQKDVRVVEFAEYNFAGGKAHSHAFPALNGEETLFALSDEEKERKKTALRLYASERGNLNYVRTEQEMCRPLASYDYSKPPHAGSLWYTRFQWVPFRHPRVDFTRPEEVSEAIALFLAASR